MSTLLIYGSGECEQLGLGDDAKAEYKKPQILKSLKDIVGVKQIACGGLHSLVLTDQGRVYSWGCNDEGALGREGPENVPELVDSALSDPMTGVTAGDCHSIAYNTSTNQIYRWGMYRNAMTGPIGDKALVPVLIGQEEFKGLNIRKVASGAHHTLVLANTRVYGWGDPETGKTGRMLKSRNKNSQSLMIEAIGIKKAQDIFCGSDSSYALAFNRNGKQVVYSWGLNNWGQLGIGHRENSSTPTPIKEFKDIPIKMISSGAMHTIALTESGELYSWGKNEEGQLGIGDTYSEHSRQINQERFKIEAEEIKMLEEFNKQLKLAEEKDNKMEVKKLKANKKNSVKKYEKMKQVQGSDEDKLYFTTPQKVPGLKNVHYIDSGNTYNYAIAGPQGKVATADEGKNSQSQSKMSVDEPKSQPAKVEETKIDAAKDEPDTSNLNQIYSWGIGNSYVLGTKEEDSVYEPFNVPHVMYKHLNVEEVTCGTIHVLVRASEPVVPDNQVDEKTAIGKKRKPDDMESDPKPVEKDSKVETKPADDEKEASAEAVPEESEPKDDSKLIEEQKDMSQDPASDSKANSSVFVSPSKQSKESSNIESKMEKFELSDKKSDKRPKLEETEDKDINMKH